MFKLSPNTTWPACVQGWSAAAATRPAPVAAALAEGADPLASAPEDAALLPPAAAGTHAAPTPADMAPCAPQPPRQQQQQQPKSLGQLAAVPAEALAAQESAPGAAGSVDANGLYSSSALTGFRFDRAAISRYILV